MATRIPKSVIAYEFIREGGDAEVASLAMACRRELTRRRKLQGGSDATATAMRRRRTNGALAPLSGSALKRAAMAVDTNAAVEMAASAIEGEAL